MAEPLTPEEEARYRRIVAGRREWAGPRADWHDRDIEKLLATLDAARSAAPLDVERLADVLTGMHLRWQKFCAESHVDDAKWIAAEYARINT